MHVSFSRLRRPKLTRPPFWPRQRLERKASSIAPSAVPRVRYLAQDRVQDLRALPGLWARRAHDRSRRPYWQANRLPFQIGARLVQLKKEHPSWGAPKIRQNLSRLNLGIHTPAIGTVHAVLDRHGW